MATAVVPLVLTVIGDRYWVSTGGGYWGGEESATWAYDLGLWGALISSAGMLSIAGLIFSVIGRSQDGQGGALARA